jgi:thymidylate synthase (FAD)|tara:strand:- start:17 stop:877 length:861 start_codon:yes stop_codon:yes gene_type:complete
MKVKLVSYSQGYNYTEGSNDIRNLIAYCAKVSNPSGQMNMEKADKLLAYLIKHQHWSPFEMASACLEIETTRDIARQMLRHRSFSFQEFSQRYADPTKELDFVSREARLQDTKNRQNSIDTDNTQLQMLWAAQQNKVITASKEAYTWAIKNGIAKEQARAVLPEGLMSSRLLMNGTIRSWIHYIELRSGHGTQKEHMEIARACGTAIATIFPMEKIKPMGKVMSRTESQILDDAYCEIKLTPDSDTFYIDFFVEGEKIKTEEFPGKSIHYLNSAAENWAVGIKKLN